MADVKKIIERIRAHGSNVAVDAGRLIVVNREKLPEGAFEYIRQHGRQIAQFIESEGNFEERAAVIEFDGGIDRPQAEDLTSILLASTPDDCNPADWTWFVSKAAAIIDARRRAG
ncbi:hypothetical protein C7441_12532 [Pseudaminobacter salicylatoxidans]|uniref:TubC N-terminal docking domain-containing protein n=1 Tax=Pseudaminobacter salicylatoxidans TaxID=93369 RepID=A0A316BL44_PSESE|nr:hypothetical protein [Pseudaminobacter salicylatoxidans]PWJ73848.1 hypothetical protein C7441_12532 [Pseudaminobacter salicylatoxidans]